MFKKIIFITTLFLLFFLNKTAAQKGFEYRRSINGINTAWHTLTLPDSVYERLHTDEDFRIIGFTSSGDTVEAPFILSENNVQIGANLPADRQNTEPACPLGRGSVSFKLLNQSHNERGYFYTFESPTSESINTIHLKFSNKNFDWRARLEGSFNQNEWFTLLDNYRIVGISNADGDYQFTKLNFKEAAYRYWRVCVNSAAQPEFESAELYKQVEIIRNYRKYNVQKADIQSFKSKSETVIEVDLKQIVPISYVKINVKDTFDYLRHVLIQYRNDENTPQPIWHLAASASLSSLSKSPFEFSQIKAKYLKMTIRNGDNMPLSIDDIEVKGIPISMTARFTEPANYYFFYGNKTTRPPQYDIENFRKNIPKDLLPLTLGDEQANDNAVLKPKEPFFKNKLWLWGIMLIIIMALGWQTMKMMKAQG